MSLLRGGRRDKICFCLKLIRPGSIYGSGPLPTIRRHLNRLEIDNPGTWFDKVSGGRPRISRRKLKP